MLYGDFKNCLVAVIVADKDVAINWAKDNHKNQSYETIVKDKKYTREEIIFRHMRFKNEIVLSSLLFIFFIYFFWN